MIKLLRKLIWILLLLKDLWLILLKVDARWFLKVGLESPLVIGLELVLIHRQLDHGIRWRDIVRVLVVDRYESLGLTNCLHVVILVWHLVSHIYQFSTLFERRLYQR